MKAIETTGRIEKSGFVKLDSPVDLKNKQKVRVIILYNEDDAINEKTWLASISSNPAFAFLNNKEEDIHTIHDGKPIRN
jgi:hypothetical protein